MSSELEMLIILTNFIIILLKAIEVTLPALTEACVCQSHFIDLIMTNYSIVLFISLILVRMVVVE